jgi:hypothetical protein
MSEKQKARIYVDFPTWNTLSAEQKSLMTFILKNGSICFRGEYSRLYDEESNEWITRLGHFAANIRLDNKVRYIGDDDELTDYNTVELVAEYTDSSFASDDPTISYVQSSENNGYYEDDVGIKQPEVVFESGAHTENGIIECNSLLCTANTAFKAYKYSQREIIDPSTNEPYNFDLTPSVASVTEIPSFSIPVTIKTKINSAFNEDSTIIPNALQTITSSENDDSFNHPAQISFSVKMDPSCFTNKQIDYPIRTGGFVLSTLSTPDNDIYFYKGGVVSLNETTNTAASIISELLSADYNSFTIINGPSFPQIALVNPSTFMFNYDLYYKESSNTNTYLANAFIAPLYHQDSPIGFAYFKLCKIDEENHISEVENNIVFSNTMFGVKNIEGTDTPATAVQLSLIENNNDTPISVTEDSLLYLNDKPSGDKPSGKDPITPPKEDSVYTTDEFPAE